MKKLFALVISSTLFINQTFASAENAVPVPSRVVTICKSLAPYLVTDVVNIARDYDIGAIIEDRFETTKTEIPAILDLRNLNLDDQDLQTLCTYKVQLQKCAIIQCNDNPRITDVGIKFFYDNVLTDVGIKFFYDSLFTELSKTFCPYWLNAISTDKISIMLLRSTDTRLYNQPGLINNNDECFI